MPSRQAPSKLSVNDDLEAARPMSVDEFQSVASQIPNDASPEEARTVLEGDLSDDKLDFFVGILQLAKNIREDEQYNSVFVRRKGVTPEVFCGYRRYLACLYAGEQILYESKRISDHEVYDYIFSENENREKLDPEGRAVVLAKRLGRYDEEEHQLCPPSESSNEVGMTTILDLAQKYGRSHSTVWQHLSPIRQEQSIRDEFRSSLTETQLQIIDSVAPDDSSKYALAQALQQSVISSTNKFKELVQNARNEVNSQQELVYQLCGALTEHDIDKGVGGDLNPDDVKTEAERVHERKKQQVREEEEKEKPEFGEQFSEPTSTTSEMDVSSNGQQGNEEDDGSSPIIVDGEFGNKVFETEEEAEERIGYRPSSEKGPLKIELSSEISKLVRQEARDSTKSEAEVVNNILEIHFRREGKLTSATAD